jgi:hypothetical protein
MRSRQMTSRLVNRRSLGLAAPPTHGILTAASLRTTMRGIGRGTIGGAQMAVTFIKKSGGNSPCLLAAELREDSEI